MTLKSTEIDVKRSDQTHKQKLIFSWEERKYVIG